MENAILTTVLPKFVSQVSQRDSRHDRPLTVNDLRLSIRSARMSEIRDWSNRQLDVIEGVGSWRVFYANEFLEHRMRSNDAEGTVR